MTIKAITFDFWQTLYKSKTVDYTGRQQQLKAEVEAACGHPIDPSRFEAAIKVARDTWSRAWVQEHRTIDAREWLLIILQHLNISLHPDDLLKIQTRMENSVLTDTPILTPDARTALAELSTRYRLAVISDTGLTPGRVLRQILEADDLLGYFIHLTFSDEVGRSKPHPDAFLTTLTALDAQPEQAVHVGDLLRTDIAGAQRVGMRGVQYIGLNPSGEWLHPSGAAKPNPVTPDAVIRTHAELGPLLHSWNGTA